MAPFFTDHRFNIMKNISCSPSLVFVGKISLFLVFICCSLLCYSLRVKYKDTGLTGYFVTCNLFFLLFPWNLT